MTRRWWILAIVFVSLIFGVGRDRSLAGSYGNFYFHGLAGYLRLPSQGIDFGAPKPDPSDPKRRRIYFEAINVMPVTYRAYRWVITTYNANWEVKISGDDFSNGADLIPISQLQWKIRGGNYRKMPAQGDWDSLDSSANYKTIEEKSAEHTVPISFYFPMTNDEYGGTYQGKFYATLVFY